MNMSHKRVRRERRLKEMQQKLCKSTEVRRYSTLRELFSGGLVGAAAASVFLAGFNHLVIGLGLVYLFLLPTLFYLGRHLLPVRFWHHNFFVGFLVGAVAFVGLFGTLLLLG